MASMNRTVRLRRAASAVAGPLAIVVGVLTVLHYFAFGGRISTQYPDVLPFWLPTWCLLGKSLAAGHIPAWNPHVMGGVPFAAEPQSGWMYVLPMLLFSTLSCGTAIRWFVVLQPILGGLGTYAFLGSERLSRAAATVAGLVLALSTAGSYLVLNLPFAGTMAWVPIMLAAASRALGASSTAYRLAWTAAVAGAWSQIGAANLSDGLVVGTLALVAYVGVRLASDVRSGRRNLRGAAGIVALFAVALPAVSLAVLLPRLMYLPRTSISLGYERLKRLSVSLTGRPGSGLVFGTGLQPTWPLRLALSPGVYLGVPALALLFAGWRSRRRQLFVAFALYGVASYVLMLEGTARRLWAFASSSVGGFYLHDPSRFRFGLLIAMAVLAGLGVEAWIRAGSGRERIVLLVPGLAVWAVLPRLFGVGRPGLPAIIGAVLGAAALVVAWRQPSLAALVPLALLVELVANGLQGQLPAYHYSSPPGARLPRTGPIDTLLTPSISIASYMRENPIERTLAANPGGRYITLFPRGWDPRGYHVHQRRVSWPLLGMQQSMLFGLEEAQGYNPAQLRPFWTLVRMADPKVIRYNAGTFVDPDQVVPALLDVRWAVGSAGQPPVSGATRVVVDGPWALYRLDRAEERASVVGTWTSAPGYKEALQAVLAPGFDPASQAVVEGAPARPGARQPSGTASFRWLGAQSATVLVRATEPSMLVVRNAFDENWRVTVDGQPAPLLRADGLIQAVPVPAGNHVVALAYDDPTVGYGLLGSAAALVVLLAPTLRAATRRRTRAGLGRAARRSTSPGRCSGSGEIGCQDRTSS